MNKKRSLAFSIKCLSFIFNYNQAFAEKTGKGGDAVVCRESGVSRAEMLGLFEGRVLLDHRSALGNPKEPYRKKIERVLKNLSKVSPLRAKTI